MTSGWGGKDEIAFGAEGCQHGHCCFDGLIWAHAGWDLTGERTIVLMRSLLGKHPNLYMSVKIDGHGSQLASPFGPNGELKPEWLALLHAFPERFMVGSDQFFDEDTE